MIDIEMKVSQDLDYQRIAFFHHLIFERAFKDSPRVTK